MDGVEKAILAKQGVVLKNINEYNILLQFKVLHERKNDKRLAIFAIIKTVVP